MQEYLDYLRSTSISDPQLDEVPVPTYVVITDDQASFAIDRIAEYFGADPTRCTVRLRFGDEDRYLHRDALLIAYGGGTKAFGAGGGMQLPGYHAHTAEYEFRCPVPGCPDSPIFLLTFAESPTCRRHHTALELAQ